MRRCSLALASLGLASHGCRGCCTGCALLTAPVPGGRSAGPQTYCPVPLPAPRHAEEVFTYVSRMYAVREKEYPYTGAAGPCRAATAKTVGAVTLEASPGYEVVPGDVASVKRALVERGPLAAYMHVSEEFLAYDSGEEGAENLGMHAPKYLYAQVQAAALENLLLRTATQSCFSWPVTAGIYTPGNCKDDTVNHAVVRQTCRTLGVAARG